MARGYCNKHYTRLRKRGDALASRPTTEERFWAKVDADGDCWVWTGAIHLGYGIFGVATNVTRGAHRWSYEHLVGTISEGLQLDHLCRNRACVNPDHLEPVPRRLNIVRGFSPPAKNAAKASCRRGHALTGDNLVVRHRENGAASRSCRSCSYDGARRRYAARRRAAENPHGPVLIFTADEWDAFVGGAKDGEFDLG